MAMPEDEPLRMCLSASWYSDLRLAVVKPCFWKHSCWWNYRLAMRRCLSSILISNREKKPLSSLDAIVWFPVSDYFILWSQSFEVNYTNWFQELIQGPKWHFLLKKELNRIIKSCFLSSNFPPRAPVWNLSEVQ